MSAAENKLLIRRYIEEVVNTGNVDRMHEFVAVEYRERDDPFGQIAEGDLVATCVAMTGTHRGGWPPGAKPTNKPVRMKAVNIDRVRDGLIVEHGGAANEMLAFLELGLIRFDESEA